MRAVPLHWFALSNVKAKRKNPQDSRPATLTVKAEWKASCDFTSAPMTAEGAWRRRRHHRGLRRVNPDAWFDFFLSFFFVSPSAQMCDFQFVAGGLQSTPWHISRKMKANKMHLAAGLKCCIKGCCESEVSAFHLDWIQCFYKHESRTAIVAKMMQSCKCWLILIILELARLLHSRRTRCVDALKNLLSSLLLCAAPRH